MRPVEREVRLEGFSTKRPDAYLCSTLAINVWYRVDAEKGMVLYWAECGRATALPLEMTLKQAAGFAAGWLEHADYGSRPDIDGDSKRGWRLYTESWGHVGGEWQAFAAVHPAWALYGK